MTMFEFRKLGGGDMLFDGDVYYARILYDGSRCNILSLLSRKRRRANMSYPGMLRQYEQAVWSHFGQIYSKRLIFI